MPASLNLWTLLVLLSCGGMVTQVVEPNCTHVADFADCQGDILNFCPRGVACGCKDQKPFCKCPSYRSTWQDYWYMGPKCDHLWSSLDLILIATLPAVTLASVAIVVMQWINSCRSTPGKGARQWSPFGCGQRPQAKDNRAYVPDSADQARPASQPQKGKAADGAAQNYNFPKLSLTKQVYERPESPRFGAFSYLPHHPLRGADPAGDVLVRPSPRDAQLGDWGDNIPEADYEEDNPFAAIPMQQFLIAGG
ncbi:hypothetical protein JRQ81_007191 [Phrynocephalus forsythii]|uniref:Uncharacterized protein n=1 Tax=Phrynocephalus forsythii TaxID=171643 RepID=A0A9Q0XES1_9SAUR|nr:hypothetical protein JRQ81_007191 [Phrynocephalus forsythii]